MNEIQAKNSPPSYASYVKSKQISPNPELISIPQTVLLYKVDRYWGNQLLNLHCFYETSRNVKSTH